MFKSYVRYMIFSIYFEFRFFDVIQRRSIQFEDKFPARLLFPVLLNSERKLFFFRNAKY